MFLPHHRDQITGKTHALLRLYDRLLTCLLPLGSNVHTRGFLLLGRKRNQHVLYTHQDVIGKDLSLLIQRWKAFAVDVGQTVFAEAAFKLR